MLLFTIKWALKIKVIVLEFLNKQIKHTKPVAIDLKVLLTMIKKVFLLPSNVFLHEILYIFLGKVSVKVLSKKHNKLGSRSQRRIQANLVKYIILCIV